jgi:Zn finger protein HypA/HybF involved in hydrogenase expression
MAIHSGEKAMKSGEFRCEKCRNQVFVVGGREIPKCPNCGNDSFDPNIDESER